MVIGAGIEGADVRIVLHKSDPYKFTFYLFISRVLRRVTKVRIVTRPASTVPSAAEIPAHGVIQAPGKRANRKLAQRPVIRSRQACTAQPGIWT
jgi:hypothetical protein